MTAPEIYTEIVKIVDKIVLAMNPQEVIQEVLEKGIALYVRG